MPRLKYKITRSDLLLGCGILLLFAMLGGIWYFVSMQTSVKLSSDMEWYYLGTTHSFEKGTLVKAAGKQSAGIEGDGQKILLKAIPLISPVENTLTLTGDMIYFQLADETIRRMPQFSRISLEGGAPKFAYKNQSSAGQAGFLYDGTSTYIFLQDVTLSYNDEQVTLSALSQATLIANQLSYVDFLTKQGTTVTLEKSTVSASCPVYEIDMTGMVLTRSAGQRLLFTDPSALTSYFQ